MLESHNLTENDSVISARKTDWPWTLMREVLSRPTAIPGSPPTTMVFTATTDPSFKIFGPLKNSRALALRPCCARQNEPGFLQPEHHQWAAQRQCSLRRSCLGRRALAWDRGWRRPF